MRLPARRIAPLLALPVAAALALAGCGKTVVDPRKAEIVIRDDVQIKTDTMVDAVHCPADIEVIPGDRFTCVVIAGGGDEADAELEILDDDADLRLLGLTKR